MFQPFFVFQFINSSQYGIQTNLMCSVRVSQVTGHEHLVRLDLLQQFLYDSDVGFTQIILLNKTCFIERKIQEVNVFIFHA